MNAQMWVMLGGVLGGLGLGWLTAPAPEAANEATIEIPILAHPSAEAAEARARLVALGLRPPLVIDEGPPPPDIALLFRRDLTAIEERDGGHVVWVVDFNQTTQRRALRLGDVYQDRWRVARIGPQSVELRRRREVRVIDVFASSGIAP